MKIYRITHNETAFYPYEVTWRFRFTPFWFTLNDYNGFHSLKRAQEVIKKTIKGPVKVWEGTAEEL